MKVQNAQESDFSLDDSQKKIDEIESDKSSDELGKILEQSSENSSALNSLSSGDDNQLERPALSSRSNHTFGESKKQDS